MAEGTIRDRKELMDLLAAAMANSYVELKESQRLLYGQNLLKTYVIELDQPDDWLAPAQEAGFFADLADDDPNLVSLRSDRGATLILDRVESRFALCHSLSSADEADLAVHKLVSQHSYDRIWLSYRFLLDVADWGVLRGFTTRFDRSRFTEAETTQAVDGPVDLAVGGGDIHTDETLPVQSLKLRLWGSEAKHVLNVLRDQPPLERAVALASVRVRFFAQHPDVMTLDDLDFEGRMTARGTSYELHRAFVERIIDAYRARLLAIEEHHRVRWTKEGEVEGVPITLRLDGSIRPEKLASVLFSGTQPFRLLGLTRQLAEDYLLVTAVDLHGGHRVDFEIAPEMMRVYLRGEACANTMLRLEANLQHHLDASAEIAVAEVAA